MHPRYTMVTQLQNRPKHGKDYLSVSLKIGRQWLSHLNSHIHSGHDSSIIWGASSSWWESIHRHRAFRRRLSRIAWSLSWSTLFGMYTKGPIMTFQRLSMTLHSAEFVSSFIRTTFIPTSLQSCGLANRSTLVSLVTIPDKGFAQLLPKLKIRVELGISANFRPPRTLSWSTACCDYVLGQHWCLELWVEA